MRSAGECLIVNLCTQWLKEIDDCSLGKVKGLLERLGSNFSVQTQPLKSCIRNHVIWFHWKSCSDTWLSGRVLISDNKVGGSNLEHGIAFFGQQPQ